MNSKHVVSDEAPAVELAGITKRFPGVIANQNVNVRVERGEIHALVGENGAGKSTLMKILYGMQPADEGTMEVGGKRVNFSSPRDAIDHGIGMVHQHFMLADNFTVLENIILGSEPLKGGGRIDFNQAHDKVQALCDSYGLEINIDDLVEDLEVGERQRVEIIKVLFRGAEILILDEPTAVLVPHEVDELFRNLRELRTQGKTIIFIDHKLDEVLEISDNITVLRRGETVATVGASEVTAPELAELMVGAELPSPGEREGAIGDAVTFKAENLTITEADGRKVLNGVSFQIHDKEIVGLAGVEGNGQSELIDALLGIRPLSAGRLFLNGEDLTNSAVSDRRAKGLGYVPEDRHRRGLLLNFPLWENAMLGYQRLKPFSKRGFWLDSEATRERTEEIISRFDVRTPNMDVAARVLSGGNQQKLIVGREMLSEPEALIAAHPTRGVDVGAQAAIWESLRAARDEGLGVLLISADLDELIGLSDRLLVIFRGEIVAELNPETITPRELGGYMTGAGATTEAANG